MTTHYTYYDLALIWLLPHHKLRRRKLRQPGPGSRHPTLVVSNAAPSRILWALVFDFMKLEALHLELGNYAVYTRTQGP